MAEGETESVAEAVDVCGALTSADMEAVALAVAVAVVV